MYRVMIVAALAALMFGLWSVRTSTSASVDQAEVLSRALAAPIGVLVQTENADYQTIIQSIETRGGSVTHTYKHVRGLAATVPVKEIGTLRKLPGVVAVEVDRMVIPSSGVSYTPQPKNLVARKGLPSIVPMGGSIKQVNELDALIATGAAFDLESKFQIDGKVALDAAQLALLADQVTPNTYVNAAAQNAQAIWTTGNFGQNTITAVIDSGVWGGHFMFADPVTGSRVIGCDDLSEDVGTPDEGCSRPDNNFHGTHVASTIAGNAAIVLPANHPIAVGVARHAAPLANASSLGFPGGKLLPLLGIAPLSQIYGVKVFPAGGGGAATSTIIHAIDYVVDLKVSGGVDIDVINMSLGGASLFNGRDLESQAVDAATAAGITVVTSAGNEGPAAQTTGNPAGAQSAIAVGAIAHPVHMRTFWDFNFFPSFSGHQLFTSDEPQMAYFSSRGGTADGRSKPTVSAPGVFLLAAVPSGENPQGLGFSSGTSMASPGVAGTAALLNSWSESNGDLASPFDLTQAIVNGATPLSGYADFEQGAGANNASAALAALMADPTLGEPFPPIPPADPGSPVAPAGVDLGLLGGGTAVIDVDGLQPGMARHYYFRTTRDTSRIAVDVSGVKTRRNPFKINSFEVYLKTGTRTFEHYYANSVNVFGDAHFEVTDLSTSVTGAVTGVIAESMLIQPGFTRVIIENDWTSSGPISGTFYVTVEEGGNAVPDASVPGVIGDGEQQTPFAFPCPAFACGVRTDLTWDNDWSRYPTSDLDLILVGVDLDTGMLTALDVGGGSLNAPESNLGVIIPLGNVEDTDLTVLLIQGFDTNGVVEPYRLDLFNP